MSLDAQALSRKERLAQLRNLKRKRNDGETTTDDVTESNVASILPRRNYDPETREPVQGYFEPPVADVLTVEEEARRLEEKAKLENEPEQEEQEDKDDEEEQDDEEEKLPENWDLKREIQSDLDKLMRKTDLAINRIVRERVNANDQSYDLNKAIEQTERVV